jgi:hypothetical protein
MTLLNERIKNIPIPERMRKLPIDERGFPIPKFVPIIDGKPEFRGMDGQHLGECVRRKLCWLCAEPLGIHMTFVIGPMCGINRINAEPPSHFRCAEYAAKACPFLSQPRMRRNEKDVPEDGTVAGIGIKRNPGVALLWTTRSYNVIRDGNRGILFQLGEPEQIDVYAEGRKATAEEVEHSISTGIPLLMNIAVTEGRKAVEALQRQIDSGIALIARHMQATP